jgi:heat shock protein HtpX
MTPFLNNVKTAVLLAMLTALFVLVGGLIGQQFIIPFLILGVLINVGVWFFSDKIAIATMRCREVDAQTGGDLYRLVDELRTRAGLPMPRVYVSPQEAPNAFATGRSPRHAAVAVTEGAMRLLDRDELAGVIGHELTHVKNRDTLTTTIAATIAGVLSGLARYSIFFGGGSNRENGHPIIGLLTILLAGVGAALIKSAISRSREFVADAGGARLAGSPHGLIAALQKLEAYSRRIPMEGHNPALNSLFIIEPMMGESVTRLFASHPRTEDRIIALRKLA